MFIPYPSLSAGCMLANIASHIPRNSSFSIPFRQASADKSSSSASSFSPEPAFRLPGRQDRGSLTPVNLDKALRLQDLVGLVDRHSVDPRVPGHLPHRRKGLPGPQLSSAYPCDDLVSEAARKSGVSLLIFQ